MTLNAAPTYHRPKPSPNSQLEVALPEPGKSMEQDAEWCVVRTSDQWRRIRFHDYDQIFTIPGLYEKVIYEILQCSSPKIVTGLLAATLEQEGESACDLRVLDLGAGNGMIGERLAKLGANFIVGVDIAQEAAEATKRDRPGIYNSYHVVDLTRLNEVENRTLAGYEFNCLTCVAALGFGDIPTEAFTAAYNLIRPGGWIAFNIKEEFLENHGSSGFAELIRSMSAAAIMDVRRRQRYQHRLGTDRRPIHYVAFIGQKRRNIS